MRVRKKVGSMYREAGVVPVDGAVVEVEHVGADRVEEGARVRDDDQRLVPALWSKDRGDY